MNSEFVPVISIDYWNLFVFIVSNLLLLLLIICVLRSIFSKINNKK
ncbi:hypothetical protein [Terrisporobacter petrolearius]